ncbi:MAG: phosphopyruvate hydratase [Gammaproteobacteria bacterium]
MITGKIAKVIGRRVWDSRGRPTVEAEILLASGCSGRAIAPAGASRGKFEAVELRDSTDKIWGGLGVNRAVEKINTTIHNALKGQDVMDQEAVDQLLIELDGTVNKSRLGGNSTIAVSMAAAKAAANEATIPLYLHLLGTAEQAIMPLPEVQIFGGGAHAGGRIDFQDFMVVPGGAATFNEAIEWCVRVYMAAGRMLEEQGKLCGVADEGGYWPDFQSNEDALVMLIRAIENAGFTPGEDVGISIDFAASEFFDGTEYHLSLSGEKYDADSFSELIGDWITRYPIWSIEDPLSQDDFEGMKRITRAFGDKVQIIGDDFLVTNVGRIQQAITGSACNAVLIKPNQTGTLTETHEALLLARKAGWGTIISARSGETEDTTIAHLVVGWGAGQFKVGSVTRSERLAKWNEVIRIEENLNEKAVFSGSSVLPFKDAEPVNVGITN